MFKLCVSLFFSLEKDCKKFIEFGIYSIKTSLDFKRREKTVKVAIKYLNLVDSFVSL